MSVTLTGRIRSGLAHAQLSPLSLVRTPPLKGGRLVRTCASKRGDIIDSSSGSERKSEFDEWTRPWEAPGYRGAVISALPENQQKIAFAAISAGISVGTALICALSLDVGDVGAGVLGALYILGGVAHFAVFDQYTTIVPHEGAFGGLWRVPGTPAFHVTWTGIAEMAGGLGLIAGGPVHAVPHVVGRISGFALFVLTIAITPANIYAATNNAPGPGPPPEDGELPPLVEQSGHVGRAVAQCVLLAALWSAAFNGCDDCVTRV
ncbi:hypothetical protein NFJ02_16g23170 [Pycnococcus provasolii]